MPPQQQQQQDREKERDREPLDERKAEKVDQNYSKKRVGEGDVKLDQERLVQAIADERKRKARGGKDDGERSGKKQKSSLESGSHEVTEEELGTSLYLYISTRSSWNMLADGHLSRFLQRLTVCQDA